MADVVGGATVLTVGLVMLLYEAAFPPVFQTAQILPTLVLAVVVPTIDLLTI